MAFDCRPSNLENNPPQTCVHPPPPPCSYLFTAKMRACAAMTLLQERARVLQSVGGAGGVYTVRAVLYVAGWGGWLLRGGRQQLELRRGWPV
jgi:hypothetical protein